MIPSHNAAWLSDEKCRVAIRNRANQTKLVSASLHNHYRCLAYIETKMPTLPTWSMEKLSIRTAERCRQAPSTANFATRPTTFKYMFAIGYLCMWTGYGVLNVTSQPMGVPGRSVVAVLKDPSSKHPYLQGTGVRDGR